MKIIILEPLAVKKSLLISRLAAILAGKGDLICYDDSPADEAEAAKRGADADIIISAGYPLSRDIISAWEKAKLLVITGISTEHIDLATCEQQQLEVLHNTAYAVISRAELTVSMALSLLHRLPEQLHKNNKKLLLAAELAGKRWGMLGYDDSSGYTTSLIQAFDCDVYHARPNDAAPAQINEVEMSELLKKCDIISLHLPYEQQQPPFLDSDKLSMLKSTAILINTAHPGLVDNIALAYMLSHGQLAGAGIDLAGEIWDKHHPLYLTPRAIITPNCSAATKEAMIRRTEQALTNLVHWLKTHNID